MKASLTASSLRVRLRRLPRRALASAWTKYSIVTVAMGLIAIAVTWPHAAQFSTTVLGGGGDALGGVRILWALDVQGGNPFTTHRDAYLGAPEGSPVSRSINIANVLFVGSLWLLGKLFGWIVAFNAYNLAALIFTGTAAFVLLDRLRSGILPAAFGAYVFTFNPNHLEKAAGHVPLVATGILPLLLLALLRKRASATIGRSSTVAALLLVAFYLNSYLGLLGLWLTLVFCAVDCLLPPVGSTRARVLRSYYFVALLWVVGLLPIAASWYSDRSAVAALAEGRREVLIGGGASAELYLFPGPRHPWLGGPMSRWLETNLSWEFTMFFGYTTILLAIAGVALAVTKWRRAALSRDASVLVVFALALTLSSLWASLPPLVRVGEFVAFFGYTTIAVALGSLGLLSLRRYGVVSRQATALVVWSLTLAFSILWVTLPESARLGNFDVPALGFFLRELTTIYRVFSRFGVLVGLGLILLAVYALANLPRRRLPLLPVIALVAVAFELYVPPPKVVAVQDVRTPTSVAELAKYGSGRPEAVSVADPLAYLRFLKQQPPGIVTDYPNPGAPDGRWAWRDVFYQYIHEHPLWQTGGVVEPDADGVRERAGNLEDTVVPSILATYGVKYIVVHRARYDLLRLAQPFPTCGLKRLATFPNEHVDVYRVHAAADQGFAVREGGFHPVANAKVWPEDRGLRWMSAESKVALFSPHDGEMFLTGMAVSLERSRKLEVIDGSGVSVGAWEILENETHFRFALPVRVGINHFTLRATPGTQRRSAFDVRQVSIAISALGARAVGVTARSTDGREPRAGVSCDTELTAP